MMKAKKTIVFVLFLFFIGVCVALAANVAINAKGGAGVFADADSIAVYDDSASDGATITGTQFWTWVANKVAGSDAKATPVDADTMPITDSGASSMLKKVTWANIKAALKTYFDTLYASSSISVDDTPSDGDTTDAISSNWAYDQTHFNLSPSENTIQGGIQMTGTAGEVLTAFKLLYKKSDGKYYLFDADGTDISSFPVPVAMSTEGASADASFTLVTGLFLLYDSDLSLAFTNGCVPIYADDTTPGGLTLTAPSTSGDKVLIVGHLWSANKALLSLPVMIDVEVP